MTLEICFELWLGDDEIREWRRATGGRRRAFLVVDVALLVLLFTAIFAFASLNAQYFLGGYFVLRLIGVLARLPDRRARGRALLRSGAQIQLTSEAYVVLDSRGSAEKYPWQTVTKVKETRLLWLFRFGDGRWGPVPKSRLSDDECRQLATFVQGPALPAARVSVRR